MRVFMAMLSHETNTFSTLATDRAQFAARELRYGGEILEVYRGTATCLGGMIDGAGARGLMLLPSLAAAASDGNSVSPRAAAPSIIPPRHVAVPRYTSSTSPP